MVSSHGHPILDARRRDGPTVRDRLADLGCECLAGLLCGRSKLGLLFCVAGSESCSTGHSYYIQMARNSGKGGKHMISQIRAAVALAFIMASPVMRRSMPQTGASSDSKQQDKAKKKKKGTSNEKSGEPGRTVASAPDSESGKASSKKASVKAAAKGK